MKAIKLIALTAACSLALALASCGGDSSATPSNLETTDAPVASDADLETTAEETTAEETTVAE